jgi:hypothetical protein
MSFAVARGPRGSRDPATNGGTSRRLCATPGAFAYVTRLVYGFRDFYTLL